MYIRCIYGNFGREITNITVIYGVYVRFWPTLLMCNNSDKCTMHFAVKQHAHRLSRRCGQHSTA